MVNTNKLRGRIIEMGLTQGDVAKSMGIAQPTLSQKINNIRPLDVNEAVQIANLLDIPSSDYEEYFFYTPVAQCNN